uniref:Putative ovule protein n=1 Tax=Solanum chacoense TaxID=4108 RepID=A0A0V0GIS3_SOLCH
MNGQKECVQTPFPFLVLNINNVNTTYQPIHQKHILKNSTPNKQKKVKESRLNTIYKVIVLNILANENSQHIPEHTKKIK